MNKLLHTAIITSIFLFLRAESIKDDPAVFNIKYNEMKTEEIDIKRQNHKSRPLTPPELYLTLTPGQDTVFVSFTANQPLAAGWLDTSFCSVYQNWDYWWLNTRLGIDGLDTVYVLVSLYNYSNSNENFHRDVLDYTGNLIHQDPEWNGYQTQPIVKDGAGRNHYIGHPVLGWFDNMDAGVVDDLNYIYTSKADNTGDILFSKLDSIGGVIYDKIPVATGDSAQSWTGDSHIAINSQGEIYIAWSRNLHEIVYSKSADAGSTWSAPVPVADDFAHQVNKPEILISADDCIHFIWQHWDGTHNHLLYKKLYPDGTCSVDTTNLTPEGTVEVWAPEFAVDSDTNIHIVWSPYYQGSNSLYYTLINGKCDKNGFSAADSEITIIQESAFYSNGEQKRYPKIVIDSLDCPHVIFDQGGYGSGLTKAVYHIKKVFIPQGYVVYPDSSVHNLIIDTTGGYTSSFPTPLFGTYFVKVWAWNSAGEVGWDTASIFISGISDNTQKKLFTPSYSISPTISRGKITFQATLSAPSRIEISIYDCIGRKRMEQYSFNCIQGVNKKTLDLSHLPAGVYFLKFNIQKGSGLKKVLLLD